MYFEGYIDISPSVIGMICAAIVGCVAVHAIMYGGRKDK